MKHTYTLIAFIFTTFIAAQSYDFVLLHNGGYNFSVVATPDFSSNGNTDISDIGFALMLPTGNADIANLTPFFGRNLSVTEVTATQLSNANLGDGTRDGFLINLPPGQTLLSHTNGVQIIIVTFEITNMPTSGAIEFLSNTDPIAVGLGGALNSFYNANIDGSSTQDYFGSISSSQGHFLFSVLDIEDEKAEFKDLKIYPNPALTVINIDTSVGIEKIKLYDITGKLIREINTKIIDIKDLISGIYLLKIYTENTMIVRRLIKE